MHKQLADKPMDNFSLTKQQNIFPSNIESFAYHIKDDLLHQCIGVAGRDHLKVLDINNLS